MSATPSNLFLPLQTTQGPRQQQQFNQTQSQQALQPQLQQCAKAFKTPTKAGKHSAKAVVGGSRENNPQH